MTLKSREWQRLPLWVMSGPLAAPRPKTSLKQTERQKRWRTVAQIPTSEWKFSLQIAWGVVQFAASCSFTLSRGEKYSRVQSSQSSETLTYPTIYLMCHIHSLTADISNRTECFLSLSARWVSERLGSWSLPRSSSKSDQNREPFSDRKQAC